MDPASAFGIVTGSIQTVQIIAQTLQGLWVLRGKFTDADRTINSLISQLKTIQSAITQLHEWAKSTTRGSPQHDDFLDSLDVAVDGCHAVMEVLSEEVAKLTHGIPNFDTGPLGIRARMRIVWNEPSMRDHEQRLQAQVLAMQLLLQVCQCRTASEQVELLRRETNRNIIRRVAADTATLRSRTSAANSVADSMSIRQSTIGDTVFEFDDSIVSAAAYRRVMMREHQRLTLSQLQDSNSPVQIDEGYASGTTSTQASSPALSLSAKRPTSHPSDAVSRSFSYSPGVSRFTSTVALTSTSKSTSGVRRFQSAPGAIPSRIGSTKDKVRSAFRRLNTVSRKSLSNLPVTRSSSLSSIPKPKVVADSRSRNTPKHANVSINLNTPEGMGAPVIIKATQSGAIMQVEAEINKGVDLDIHHQPSMRTSLAVAAHCGYADIVELLIHNGANLNSRDCELSTPLHLASSRGHVDVLKLILAEQVDVNARDSKGRTPFLVAVDAGHLSATRLLLNNGARTMIRGEHQMTALHMAAKEGDLELVSLLLEYGLDLEAKDVHLKVALHHACEQGHVDVTALLLSRNANIEAAGDFKTTPLICAAASGQLEIVKFLLKRGAYAKATDEHRMSALHWAAFNGHLDIVRLLLHRKAPIKATTNQGRTALHLAILNRQFSVAEFLIRSKAPLEIYCREGLTPLHYACNMNNFEVVRLLTSAGANLDAPVEVKRIRPVHIAAALGSLDMIKLFCLNRANIDALDFAGIRALCIACRNGHTAIARELLAAGAELHARSLTVTADDSPLCLAAMGGHADVVSLLLSKGACVEQKDQMGWDAPLYAAHNGHPHVLRLLLEFCLASQRIELPPLFLKVGFSPDAKISHQDKELVKDLVRACDPALSEQPQSTRSSLGIGAIRPSPGASSVSASLSSAHEPLFESVDFGNSAYMLQPARGNIPLSLISTMTQSAIDPHAPVELDTAPELNGQQRSGSFTISRHISGQGSNTVGYLPTILETEPQSPAHTLLSSSNLERFSIPTPPPESPPLQRRRETFNSGGPSSISTPQSGPSPLISAASSRFYTPDTSPNIALTGERVFSSPVISESSTTFYTPDISPDLNWRHKFTHTSQFDSCRDDTPDSSDAGSITSMFTAPEAPEGQTPVFELEG